MTDHDKKMRELDEYIDRTQRAIHLQLVGLMLRNLQNFRYTNNGTAG